MSEGAMSLESCDPRTKNNNVLCAASQLSLKLLLPPPLPPMHRSTDCAATGHVPAMAPPPPACLAAQGSGTSRPGSLPQHSAELRLRLALDYAFQSDQTLISLSVNLPLKAQNKNPTKPKENPTKQWATKATNKTYPTKVTKQHQDPMETKGEPIQNPSETDGNPQKPIRNP